MQFTPLRTAIIAIVAVLGIVFAIPNFFSKDTTANWPGWLPHNGMTLGLDLQGGSYLLLQVNKDSVITERLKSLRRDARQILAGDNGIGNIITTDADGLTIELTDPTQKAAAQTALQKLQPSGVFGVGGGSQELVFGETPDGKLTVKLSEQGIGVLSMRNKVNRLEEIFMKLVEAKAEQRDNAQKPGAGTTT